MPSASGLSRVADDPAHQTASVTAGSATAAASERATCRRSGGRGQSGGWCAREPSGCRRRGSSGSRGCPAARSANLSCANVQPCRACGTSSSDTALGVGPVRSPRLVITRWGSHPAQVLRRAENVADANRLPNSCSDADLGGRDGCSVAGAAHLRVSLPEPLGIESRTMRVEVPPPLHSRRVTGHAVPLGVAGDTAL